MEENLTQEDGSCVKNVRSKDIRMGIIYPPNEYQVKAAILGNFPHKTAPLEPGRFNGDTLNNKGNAESFDEGNETSYSKWIELVRKDTRALERWSEENTADRQNINAKVFALCPFFHPCENLTSAKQDENGDFGNQSTRTGTALPLEITLSRSQNAVLPTVTFLNRISKARREKTLENKVTLDLQDEALASYCQQHAYSRSRLSRTDRRSLANELLEQYLNLGEATLPTQSSCPTLFPETPTSPQRTNTRTMRGGYADTQFKNGVHGYSSHRLLSVCKNAKPKNNGSEQRKKSINGQSSSWTRPTAYEMSEYFTVTPCCAFPNKVLRSPSNR